jgi:hypothetical protein
MKLYLTIAALALYGDLLKRVLGATAALLSSYAIFGFIIATCFMKAYAPEAQLVRAGNEWFSTVCLALLGAYLIQLLTHFDAPLFEAFGSAVYIVLPLAYIVTIARCFPQFDLCRLAQSFLVLMPPIVAVALIQYFADAAFLVDTTYSETGGVVARNFLDNDILGGDTYYKRMPSILASADRLSAMGMMQLYFCVLVLHGSSKMTLHRALWLLFSLASAIAVLIIAGARSRILIIGVAIALAGLPMVRKLIARARQRQRSTRFFPVAISMVVAMVVGTVWAARIAGSMDGALDSLPIIRQLNATMETGDFWVRIMEYFVESFVPDNVTIFGLGLGTAGVGGRPGEIALRAMWIESGVFWTVLMLLMHAALALRLLQCLVGAIRLQTPYSVFLCAISFLMWMLGLTAGFGGTFELSTALTLFPAVAVITTGVTLVRTRGHIGVARTCGP